jgi:hypothetical protein
MHLLNECECSKMVWRILRITDMTVHNLLSLVLKHNELEIRSDIIAQLVVHKQVLYQDDSTRVTIGKYATGLVCNNNCTDFAQNHLNRLQNAQMRLNYSAFLSFCINILNLSYIMTKSNVVWANVKELDWLRNFWTTQILIDSSWYSLFYCLSSLKYSGVDSTNGQIHPRHFPSPPTLPLSSNLFSLFLSPFQLPHPTACFTCFHFT